MSPVCPYSTVGLMFARSIPEVRLLKMELGIPAVLGIQASESPPRYVAFSRIRQAMQSVNIREYPIDALDPCGGLNVKRMYQPEVSVCGRRCSPARPTM